MARLSGSTLIEVLTSLALLGLIFAIGMTLVARLGGASSPQSQQWLEAQAYTYLHEPDFMVGIEEKEINGRLLRKRVISEGNGTDLCRVIVEIYNQEQLMIKRQRWAFLEK
ncbi:MAG: hypothetical protein AAFR59_17435 [Bacteroidota bacterium]